MSSRFFIHSSLFGGRALSTWSTLVATLSADSSGLAPGLMSTWTSDSSTHRSSHARGPVRRRTTMPWCRAAQLPGWEARGPEARSTQRGQALASCSTADSRARSSSTPSAASISPGALPPAHCVTTSSRSRNRYRLSLSRRARARATAAWSAVLWPITCRLQPLRRSTSCFTRSCLVQASARNSGGISSLTEAGSSSPGAG
mmetsp:Transcript_12348/g.41834  ORF Transcript_12348/g.41834 Transcript_12348/m.41834 type:complete len:201 (+) Transcript_12348:524-1126(+)